MSQARILVVDDDPSIRKIVADRLKSQGYEVLTASDGAAGLAAARREGPRLILLDVRMPKMDGFEVLAEVVKMRPRPCVVMMTAHGSIEVAVKALQEGAADFLEKPFEGAHLTHVVERTIETAGLRRRVRTLETELSSRHTLVEGESKEMAKILSTAGRAAPTDSTILLLGESGTGKEVLARHVHKSSKRGSGPFVAVNCATLSKELLQSELFGHERGAFTGADKAKAGRIELAEGGTLFLDEIGELDPAVQAKLLRVLQEREYERLGGAKTLEANVRVIAATHRNLRESVKEGAFREDLFYRLNVIAIEVPPLRDRPEDLGHLLGHLLAKHTAEAGRSEMKVSDEAMALLRHYSWPGNIRELGNVIERCVVLAPEATIEADDLPEEVKEQPAESWRPGPSLDGVSLPFREAVIEAKRRIIVNALEQTGGHQTRAAELLGMGQPYLARLIKNLKVPKP